ncbi:hypothetical protein FE257_010770 [Aspergillus nanangensis]|uniref:Phytanoyl-CoA dioxygenase n=1 Tax=Aspergillus nanangensis TaxID=2582783 RepID=A0AAD4GZA2_ASPNN|nr:hypothetical protein FE257_010770 [Aspergillus nanangensis]
MPINSPPQMARLPATSPVDDLLAAYKRDGGVIISGLLTLDQVGRFNSEIDDVLAKTKAGSESSSNAMQAFHGSNTKRLTNMTSTSETFRKEILDHNLVHELTQRTLSKGLDFANYWLNSSQVIEIGPGNPSQILHRDCFYPLIPRHRDSPEVMNNFLIALSDYKEEYGATRVIPGSHQWENFDNTGSVEQTVAAEMSPGDALWICGNVLHGGGANRSEHFHRRALSFSFCNNSLTPEEAVPRLVPLEIGRVLSKRAQQMTGFRSQPTPYGPGNFLSNFNELALTLGLDDE